MSFVGQAGTSISGMVTGIPEDSVWRVVFSPFQIRSTYCLSNTGPRLTGLRWAASRGAERRLARLGNSIQAPTEERPNISTGDTCELASLRVVRSVQADLFVCHKRCKKRIEKSFFRQQRELSFP